MKLSAPIFLIIAASAGFTTGAYLDGEISPHSFSVPIQVLGITDNPNMSIFKTAEMSSTAQSIIDKAYVDFNIAQVPDGKYFRNIIDQCIFRSDQSFKPLCIKCDFLNGMGKTIGSGEKINLASSYMAKKDVIIPMTPVSPIKFIDATDVDKVKISLCNVKMCPDDHDKCKCDEHKKDHKKHYDDFDKYYKDNKNKFSKSDYSKFMNDYEKYMDDEGKNMDKADFKMFMDYHEKFLKDNKKYMSDSDYKRCSDKHKKYSDDYPKHDEKCKCEDQKGDDKKHYDDFDKYYKDNKNKFSKSDYSKFMNDYENYFDENGKYMDSSDFKMFMDYHEKFLKDNKKYMSDDDYKRCSDKHKKYSDDYPKHQDEDECKEKSDGFFVGGGKVYVPKTSNTQSFTLTHGFELHCDETQAPNNLEINWLQNKFHLDQLVKAECIDDGTHNEPPPSPHPGPTLDIYSGEGYGLYNGQCGAYAIWKMDDNGEPGKNDHILSLVIKDKNGNVVLNINNPLSLQTGNHQFVPHQSMHPHPPTQTLCPKKP